MWGWHLLDESEKALILKGVRRNRVYGGPYHIELHPTDRCNARCFFCSTPKLSSGKETLSTKTILSVIEALCAMGLKSIRLAGGGEPLFHPGLGEILSLLESRRVRISNITTNALLLSPEISDYLVRNRCDEILVSLNAATPRTYASEMGISEAGFSKVRDNVRYLSRARTGKRGASPRLVIQFVISRATAGELPDMYALGEELDADNILIRDLWDIGDKQITDGDAAGIARKIKELEVRDMEHKRLFLEFHFSPLMKHFQQIGRQLNVASEPSAAAYCVYGWYALTVRASGGINPCCGLQHQMLGNILEDSPRNIWHGEKFALLRTELRKIIMGETVRNPSIVGDVCVNPRECVIRRIDDDPDFIGKLMMLRRSWLRRLCRRFQIRPK